MSVTAATCALHILRDYLNTDPRDVDVDLMKRVVDFALDNLDPISWRPRQQQRQKPAEANDNGMARFLSPCPTGFDTVLGWMAKVNPEALALIDEDPEATQRDGFWLKHRCRERGLPVVKVPACPWLQEQGIATVNAYPVTVLSERFGC